MPKSAAPRTKPKSRKATRVHDDARQLDTDGGAPRTYFLHGNAFQCLACGHDAFYRRSSLLNTAGMTFAGLEWLNREASNLICASCGYIHWFAQTIIPSATALAPPKPSKRRATPT